MARLDSILRQFGFTLFALLSVFPAVAQQVALATPGANGVLDADGKRAVEGVNAFSVELYKREVKPGENLFLSPASVSVAVGLAYRGAKGVTADQIARTLHFGAPPVDYLRANAQLLASLNFAGDGWHLQSANAVWVNTGLPIEPDFESDLARFAKAGLMRVDFADPEQARGTINHWVEDATHDKIEDLLHGGDLSRDTRAVLVNAIYWNGKWELPFNAGLTRSESFKLGDNKDTTTKLMHLDGDSFAVLHRSGVRAISLPYQGREVSMVVLLPDAPDDLGRLEEKLTWPTLHRWLTDLKAAPHQITILTLPKLHMDWRADLMRALAELGAPIAFGDYADFSGIAKLPYSGGNEDEVGLKFKKVIHQTTIDVEEKDTAAAAATAVITDIIVSSRRVGVPLPPPPFIFKADHPFLFAIVDNRTNMILFMGRYAKPQPAK